MHFNMLNIVKRFKVVCGEFLLNKWFIISKMVLLNVFKNNNITMWSVIYIYIHIPVLCKRHGFTMMLDVVLRASLWTDLHRSRIVGLMLCPRRGWCGWHFNHGKEGKVGISWCRRVATQANTSVRHDNDIFMFYYIKLYILCIQIMYYMYKVFIKEHWWTLVLS